MITKYNLEENTPIVELNLHSVYRKSRHIFEDPMRLLRKVFQVSYIGFSRTINTGLLLRSNAPTSLNEPKPLPIRKEKSLKTKVRPVIDFRQIQVKAGKGGDGCVSLASISKNPMAGPDGGDGGNGGHVIFKATGSKTSLDHVPSIVRADDGEKGGHRDCTGRGAGHLIIDVPIGTMFKSGDGLIVADLDQEGALFVAARGGAGGRGNHYFASDTNQAPEIAEYGATGEHISYTIELRTIADVGLIGLPNAGKSTFLRAISRARPKVAPYAFTTLQPHVGVVKYSDHEQVASKPQTIRIEKFSQVVSTHPHSVDSVADIPGLISGAHRNRGLGIAFLRHVERCVCLLYVIDTAQPEPWEQLDVLRYELEQYNGNLLTRPSGVLANKMDVPQSKINFAELTRYANDFNLPVFPVSAQNSEGLLPVLQYIRKLYDESKAGNVVERAPE